MASRSCRSLFWIALVTASCATPPYSPYPLEVGDLPDAAFDRCRDVLLRQYGSLRESDEASFRLQTAWTPIADPPGERRASVFRDERHEGELSVVVELRWLRIPLFGMPYWTSPRGDDAAERELAGRLTDALAGGVTVN